MAPCRLWQQTLASAETSYRSVPGTLSVNPPGPDHQKR